MPVTLVKKADGALEPLDYNKIKNALHRSGASRALADEVVESMQQEIKQEVVSTKKIYDLAFEHLSDLKPGAAARFSLKSSLLKMGPNGYPFETYIGALLKGRNYDTKLRQIVCGKCVNHEIDVIATRPKMNEMPATKSIVECKFHNSPHMKCHIQSALYSWARFLDIRERDTSIDACWLATNTKFTEDVIQYADCVGLKLLGWSFPRNESIQVRIDEHKLYPTTVLQNLTRQEFILLHDAGVITLKDLANAPNDRLIKSGITQKRIEKLREQAKEILAR
ncbi:MAG: ATP cone domain-containing protein [Candidatus Micrarchaeia archaeon]